MILMCEEGIDVTITLLTGNIELTKNVRVIAQKRYFFLLFGKNRASFQLEELQIISLYDIMYGFVEFGKSFPYICIILLFTHCCCLTNRHLCFS